MESNHMKPSKRISNRTNHRSLNPKPSNGAIIGGGRAEADLFFDPAAADSYSLLISNLNNPYSQPPPPLLPLPLLPTKPHNIKALSYPPPNTNKSNKRPNKSSSSLLTITAPAPLTPKKSSPKSKHHQKIKDQKGNPKQTTVSAAAAPAVVGPDLGELPRGVFVSTKGTNLNSGKQEANDSGVELSCPCIYSLAPPPSSLPLPKFALRPKLGCSAAAAAAGVSIKSTATNSFRRTLHLP